MVACSLSWESLYCNCMSESKHDMYGYGIWLAKQSSASCTTITMYNVMSRTPNLQGQLDSKCPNFDQVEKANHLYCCPDEHQMALPGPGEDGKALG